MTNYLNNKSLLFAAKYLSNIDRDLSAIFEIDGVPPLWARRPGFATLIKIILEQQVSLSSAKAINDKLHKNIKPFTPVRFLELGISNLKKLGVTRQKSSYCINLAEAVTNDKFNSTSLNKLDDYNAKQILMQIKGVGSWTADIYLLMALRRPDIWPKGDIALAKSMKKVKRLKDMPLYEEQLRIAEMWRPYRSVAARMLWQHYIKNNLYSVAQIG